VAVITPHVTHTASYIQQQVAVIMSLHHMWHTLLTNDSICKVVNSCIPAYHKLYIWRTWKLKCADKCTPLELEETS